MNRKRAGRTEQSTRRRGPGTLAVALVAGISLAGQVAWAALPSPFNQGPPPPVPKAPKPPSSSNNKANAPPPPPGLFFQLPQVPLGSPPDDPPTNHAPEPTALLSGLLGVGLLSAYGLRRRFLKGHELNETKR